MKASDTCRSTKYEYQMERVAIRPKRSFLCCQRKGENDPPRERHMLDNRDRSRVTRHPERTSIAQRAYIYDELKHHRDDIMSNKDRISPEKREDIMYRDDESEF